MENVLIVLILLAIPSACAQAYKKATNAPQLLLVDSILQLDATPSHPPHTSCPLNPFFVLVLRIYRPCLPMGSIFVDVILFMMSSIISTLLSFLPVDPM